jgi:hypothetical protein
MRERKKNEKIVDIYFFLGPPLYESVTRSFAAEQVIESIFDPLSFIRKIVDIKRITIRAFAVA